MAIVGLSIRTIENNQTPTLKHRFIILHSKRSPKLKRKPRVHRDLDRTLVIWSSGGGIAPFYRSTTPGSIWPHLKDSHLPNWRAFHLAPTSGHNKGLLSQQTTRENICNVNKSGFKIRSKLSIHLLQRWVSTLYSYKFIGFRLFKKPCNSVWRFFKLIHRPSLNVWRVPPPPQAQSIPSNDATHYAGNTISPLIYSKHDPSIVIVHTCSFTGGT